MDKKKVLVWCLIIILCILIPGIFMKQFLNLNNIVVVPTINFGNIKMPAIIAGALGFWGFLLLIYGIIKGILYVIKQLKKLISKKKETA